MSRRRPVMGVIGLTAIGIGSSLGLGAGLVGCEGHGEYTQAFLEETQRGQAQIRSATEYDLAYQQFTSGDLTESLATVDNSISLRGDVALAHTLRGRILLESARWDEAIAAFDRAIELDPAEADGHYFRGVVLERIGRLEEALASYERAAECAPTNVQHRLAIAEILIELDRLDEARKRLDAWSATFALHAGVFQTQGHIAMMEGDTVAAVRAFSEAAMLAPDDDTLRVDLCRAYAAAGRFADAEALLRRLAVDGGETGRPDLQLLHARCLLELDRPVEARAILLPLARSDDGETHVEAWIRLIDVALLLEDHGLMRRAGKQLVSIAPGRAEGYVALALWQRWNGDLAGAVRNLERGAACEEGELPAERLRAIVLREIDRARQLDDGGESAGGPG